MDYKVKLQLGNRGNHKVLLLGKKSPAHTQSSPLPPYRAVHCNPQNYTINKTDKEIMHWEGNQNK